MKRRVANLAPVSAVVFNQKVLEKRQETSIMASDSGSFCETCKYVTHPLILKRRLIEGE